MFYYGLVVLVFKGSQNKDNLTKRKTIVAAQYELLPIDSYAQIRELVIRFFNKIYFVYTCYTISYNLIFENKENFNEIIFDLLDEWSYF